MYYVLALLCLVDEECIVKAYQTILPTYESCIITKEGIHKKLWKHAPENAASVKTWCFSLPEDT